MLHHIALEYNFLREVFFDVEKTLFLNDTVKKNYDDHVLLLVWLGREQQFF